MCWRQCDAQSGILGVQEDLNENTHKHLNKNTQTQRAQVVEHWGHKPEDGHIYFVVKPPWVSVDKLQAFYTLYPEERQYQSPHTRTQEVSVDHMFFFAVEAGQRSVRHRACVSCLSERTTGKRDANVCFPPLLASHTQMQQDGEEKEDDSGMPLRHTLPTALSYASRLQWGTNFYEGTTASAFLGVGHAF